MINTAISPPLTYKAYDLAALEKMQNELFLEIFSTTFLHFQVKQNQPLLAVPLMGVFNKVRGKMRK